MVSPLGGIGISYKVMPFTQYKHTNIFLKGAYFLSNVTRKVKLTFLLNKETTSSSTELHVVLSGWHESARFKILTSVGILRVHVGNNTVTVKEDVYNILQIWMKIMKIRVF